MTTAVGQDDDRAGLPAGTRGRRSDTPRGRRMLSASARKLVLVIHIAVAVGLLGDSAGYLAVSIRMATTADQALADASLQILEMFSLTFGIPLSFASLITGLTLGLGTRWGVFRYPWVVTKLALIVSVILVGSFVLSTGMSRVLTGDDGGEALLIAGAAYDVVALAAATTLSVYKPGRRDFLRRRRRGPHVATARRQG
jgi:hypothetical protein